MQGSAEDGFEITNTHTPEVRDITVTKAWKDYDNMNSTRPDTITVQLYAGGTAYGDPVAEVALSEENSWKHVFENLSVNKVVDGKGGNAIVSNNTGDSANGVLWAMLLLLAGGALVGTVWYRRRKKI